MDERENKMGALVIESDRKSRRLLRKTLEKAGYRCADARNGKEAAEQLRGGECRLVIADWKATARDGTELLAHLRGARRGRCVYIIVTAPADEKEEALARLDGEADDYMIKPFDPAEVAARAAIAQRILRLEDGGRRDHLQLLRSQKAASVGQLAAGVAHEINTPTGFVSSNLGTLGEYQRELRGLIDLYRDVMRGIRDSGRGAPLPPEIARGVGEIETLESKLDLDFLLGDISDVIDECRTGAEKIGEVVHSLTDFSNPLRSPFEQVILNDCIDATMKVVGKDLPSGVEILYRPGKIPAVPGSPGHLNIAFLNILTNAIQAVARSGRITIETSQVKDRVIALITDTGPGMSEELVSRIFDPFFTTREPGSGRGLGLNVAYNIFEEHGGSLDVNSSPGEGTIFAIQIPLEKARTARTGAAVEEKIDE